MTNLLTLREKVAGEKAQAILNSLHPQWSKDHCGEEALGWFMDNLAPDPALASGSGDHAGLRRLVDEAADFGVPAQVDPAVLNAILAENAALGALAVDANKHSMRKADELLAERDRATEAERKLAEAVGLLRLFQAHAQSGQHFAYPLGSLQQLDTFLSKEAERG